MTNRNADWADTLAHLLALAAQLEGEGQYNIAKLARAVVESLTRQAAFEIALPSDREELVDEKGQITASSFPVSCRSISVWPTW